MAKNLLKNIGADYLLVNSTNEFLVEYSDLKENARYTLTGFSGSTGDALVSNDGIYLFVDGRYHIQADNECFKNIQVIKLKSGQRQDDLITEHIKPDSTFAIVSKKISQKRYEDFQKKLKNKKVKFKFLDTDPINNYTEEHSQNFHKTTHKIHSYKPKKAKFITNLEDISYITGFRDFSRDYSSKIWAKLYISDTERKLFFNQNETDTFLEGFRDELGVDKKFINVHDYNLIKKPIPSDSGISDLKSLKTPDEIKAYKKAFKRTDEALNLTREYIENNEPLSEYDIACELRNNFIKTGAKNLSFKPIVAIDENSALAHYSQNSKEKILKEGSLVLIDCGAYYEEGLATDITRVFVKGTPNELQKRVYTTVLKTFLQVYNSKLKTGIKLHQKAQKFLENSVEGFVFNHGLGHGIGINVHEAPPGLNLTDSGKVIIKENMCYTIEPGLYNKAYFGVRLENSCYRNSFEKSVSLTSFGFEKKLIDFNMLSKTELKYLSEFNLL